VNAGSPPEGFDFRGNAALGDYLASLSNVHCEEIGESRGGQALYGLIMGRGHRRISIIAGSHADEPVGPATAQALPLHWASSPLLEEFTFCIVPQMNPDGADANRAWFNDAPDLVHYLRHARREAPGDDVEFNFDVGGRPENRCAMEFLHSCAPFEAHFSLHGMAFGEGAWYLICNEWQDRTRSLRERIVRCTHARGLPLHDIDRKGEKGFTRIAPGFCTTPASDAMQAHFERQGDAKTAAKFKRSSMEYAQFLGGDPL